VASSYNYSFSYACACWGNIFAFRCLAQNEYIGLANTKPNRPPRHRNFVVYWKNEANELPELLILREHMSIFEMVTFLNETEPVTRLVICIRVCDAVEYSTFAGLIRGYVQDFAVEHAGSKAFNSLLQRSSGSGHPKLDPKSKILSVTSRSLALTAEVEGGAISKKTKYILEELREMFPTVSRTYLDILFWIMMVVRFKY
jgi:hypothetical protein